ncbi:class I SAM-dependent methyltransferase [Mycobacterium avium]|uniref:Methyltransferase domain-containing protein n=1 Tax=Mycolicibacterium paratuberculosis (strain ATCC BAA-968 / K-10) TaxID=262316 RepID=Q73YH9_MYCPA|nr:class I SAM-dependent methyltransferase [Mycobacterium avium]ETB04495.1 SAM-dependent methlyltransferase [Mycobacterium avium subsp. paratuberculosis 10-5864]ETB12130.1 SAM-dependent methlyltransferase [Mycobacterium avium subsp. paratuberculosis 08-8281]ETB40224.1 SAM-dependent methlyltransferase [Mycobacterium avium subsp. paratuberculosis 11-1786]ETB52273.1 SAM-dependent methlyltransferase [Mycobacterium avium subsp. paratuberculosis 10-8425]AAS04294.1 hypothetical protein MAP_1977c [Myc
MDTSCEPGEAGRFWEERYRGAERVWSGRVNPRLAELAADLPAGRALDLGCGEGADALWLAQRGWTVLAVDISATALRRAAEAAALRKLLARIDFQRHDLNESFPEGMFDLVSAQYFHSPVHLDRDAVLRRAATRVKPGGVLLIVDHGAAPPWAQHDGHHIPGVEEVLGSLRLDPDGWTRLRAEAAGREMTGPNGEVGTLMDNIMMLRRTEQAYAAS